MSKSLATTKVIINRYSSTVLKQLILTGIRISLVDGWTTTGNNLGKLPPESRMQLLRMNSFQLADAFAAIGYCTIGSLGILVVMELISSWRFIWRQIEGNTLFKMITDEDEIEMVERLSREAQPQP